MLKSASSRASSSSVKSNNSQVSSEAPVKLSRFSKPSDKVNPKTSFQLGNTKSKSAFSSAYSKGTIPCRLQHGSVKNSLVWTVQVETIKNFDPLLILFFQGLIEVDHPFNFIVGQGITDLLNSYGAYEKTVSVLPFLVMPLRLALMSKNRVPFV